MTFWEYAPGLFLNLTQVTHLEDASPTLGVGAVRVWFVGLGSVVPLTAEKADELRRILGSASMAPFVDAHTR